MDKAACRAVPVKWPGVEEQGDIRNYGLENNHLNLPDLKAPATAVAPTTKAPALRRQLNGSWTLVSNGQEPEPPGRQPPL